MNDERCQLRSTSQWVFVDLGTPDGRIPALPLFAVATGARANPQAVLPARDPRRIITLPASPTAGAAIRPGRQRAFSSSSHRLWCSLAQLRSTVPSPIASNAPSMPIVPM